MPGHAWWGSGQWAAYLEYQEQPIKASSKTALADLESGAEDSLSAHAYTGLLLEDPLLALRLIKAANRRLPRRLARDITTPLGVVLALGTEQFREQVRGAPEVGGDNHGFLACETRATLAARICMAWGGLRHDLDPGELAMAALLANAGEIELWAFVPELPQKALDELHSGRTASKRSARPSARCRLSRQCLNDRSAPPPVPPARRLRRPAPGRRGRRAGRRGRRPTRAGQARR